MKKRNKTVVIFLLTFAMLLLLAWWAINAGSIKVSWGQILKGLFIEYDREVALIYNLRFPRIFIAIFAGAGLAVAGILLQAVLKNPLADPGIIGISSGAGFFTVLGIALFPTLVFITPVLAFIGGAVAFLIVYSIAWIGGAKPVRIILVGIAIHAMFEGLLRMLNYMSGQRLSQVTAIVEGNIAVRAWADVKILAIGITVGLIMAYLTAGRCNLLSLSKKTVSGLGLRVNVIRLYISAIAILLACTCTAVVGGISFLGLIVPHIGRLLVGKNHKILIPYTALLGAVVYLAADTLGKTVAYPYEIPAAILMAVIGGPCFILLLRRSKIS